MAGILPDIKNESDFFRKKLFLSSILPGIFVFLMWLSKTIEILFVADFTRLGIKPLEIRGLPGIVLSPFIHENFRHLLNNSLPLFFLSVALFYLYSEVAVRVFLISWVSSGILVWLTGRDAWHIGASGLVYGLASFLFFSGIIRKYFRLVALSLLIVFLYGSMVWGIFPGVYRNVSWEAHMLGFISGVVLAIWYRNEGPQAPRYEWMEEQESDSGSGSEEEDDLKEQGQKQEMKKGESGTTQV